MYVLVYLDTYIYICKMYIDIHSQNIACGYRRIIDKSTNFGFDQWSFVSHTYTL